MIPVQTPIPIAWTIAGSDSGAGAGIQADIKTMQQLSVYCCSVITAVTAQNTCGVLGIEPVSAEMVKLQLSALKTDLTPKAIKIGMVYSKEIIDALVTELGSLRTIVVYDPVLLATSGDALVDETGLSALRSKMLPLASLITPNWAEAHILTGQEIVNPLSFSETELDWYVERLAALLLKLGPASVLIKGGHTHGVFAQDFWTDGIEKAWFTSVKQHSHRTHGTGCTLSAAIAAGLAKESDMRDAIVIAKAYINQAIRQAPEIGKGNSPLTHERHQFAEQDLPWQTSCGEKGRLRPEFERDTNIGFYPIVPSSKWVETLSAAGVGTIQLRIKNMPEDLLENEISSAIWIAKNYNCNLYINDYWHLAIKHGAYGVHLGQEDLQDADTDRIAKAGIKLGISTHSYSEVARALAVQPSYIAIGPIYPTTTKEMKFAPQGKTGLASWRRSLSYPLVAIGGISLDLAEDILSAGADSIAVVRDIIDHPEPNLRAQEWLKLW